MKFRLFSGTKYLWLVIVLLSIIAILFKSIYREYIYSNEINDFGVADSSPNFFAGLIIVLFYYVQYQKVSLKVHALFAAIGLIGYELIQRSVFKSNVFDYKDILASIIGVTMGYLICSGFKIGALFNSPIR
ncbi:hypothetical protein [Sphingobacterium faecale]|uniref:VanZ family protein n=1 Tax=Sphingobacterium faecale TaxID=2803775 RepID=A0ABS1R5C2_9SPHI|nr:hypothetical protein [Sphingobacterium faecale]MBL1409906.1 hypothetical protein [Sphingobacterium faecale]